MSVCSRTKTYSSVTLREILVRTYDEPLHYLQAGIAFSAATGMLTLGSLIVLPSSCEDGETIARRCIYQQPALSALTSLRAVATIRWYANHSFDVADRDAISVFASSILFDK